MLSHIRLVSFRRISTIQALRIAPSSLQSFRVYRNFHATPQRKATDNSDVFISAFKDTALFREMADKPEVLQATTDLVKVLQEEGMLRSGHRREYIAHASVALGFVVNPEKPPSVFQLLGNAKIRQQLMITVAALKEAGIDAEQLKEAYTAMQGMKKGSDS
ncbi:hypothetical protein NLI96_g12188 [Meripilus lineatus]|uniref:Uncharacterized protein n=1 Tax=Meripilus lineatus TaxID=2056292 RepID=A0AAD5URS9_9APHY|nr:hypothetical protein NLI96_g12188 [Physisporinus lineatus]